MPNCRNHKSKQIQTYTNTQLQLLISKSEAKPTKQLKPRKPTPTTANSKIPNFANSVLYSSQIPSSNQKHQNQRLTPKSFPENIKPPSLTLKQAKLRSNTKPQNPKTTPRKEKSQKSANLRRILSYTNPKYRGQPVKHQNHQNHQTPPRKHQNSPNLLHNQVETKIKHQNHEIPEKSTLAKKNPKKSANSHKILSYTNPKHPDLATNHQNHQFRQNSVT